MPVIKVLYFETSNLEFKYILLLLKIYNNKSKIGYLSSHAVIAMASSPVIILLGLMF